MLDARKGTVRVTWVGRASGRLDQLGDRAFALLSFLPGAILVGGIVLPPILAVVVMSLFRIELVKAGPNHFVGLDNYERLLRDSDFLNSIPRTLIFAGLTTALAVALALCVALILVRTFRGASALSVALLLPWAIAPVVTGIYWRFIFQSNFGLATGIATWLGFTDQPVRWLANPTVAMGVAAVANAWRSVPLLALILLAALRGISPDQYRAAKMDGARALQRFGFVTLPAIRNALIVVTVLQLVISLQVFDLIFALTGGGPGRETTVTSIFIYQRAFQNLSFGYSAALAVTLLAITALAATLLLLGRRRTGVEAREADA
jgi:multiple sugar transport system permease protein